MSAHPLSFPFLNLALKYLYIGPIIKANRKKTNFTKLIREILTKFHLAIQIMRYYLECRTIFLSPVWYPLVVKWCSVRVRVRVRV